MKNRLHLYIAILEQPTIEELETEVELFIRESYKDKRQYKPLGNALLVKDVDNLEELVYSITLVCTNYYSIFHKEMIEN